VQKASIKSGAMTFVDPVDANGDQFGVGGDRSSGERS
jgi:hypothetical protein